VQKKCKIAITAGDPNGIGPEVICKSLADPFVWRFADFILVGPEEVFKPWLERYELLWVFQNEVNDNFNGLRVLWTHTQGTKYNFTDSDEVLGGEIAGNALEIAIQLALDGLADALVTAPISKRAINRAGFPFPGHTEFLAQRCGARQVVMVLINGQFRVALATGHVPLSKVASELNVDLLVEIASVLDADLRSRFGVSQPEIAIAALNPHAGESGLFGNEEKTVIEPAMAQMKKNGMKVAGPFPADTLFCNVENKTFDVYLAMYHDQGLIPLKMRSFGSGVNYTAGLPIIRTSPDHGTANDIAGLGIADPGSMKEAIKLAVEITTKR